MAKTEKKQEFAKFGLLEFIRMNIGKFKVSNYEGVLRAGKLNEALEAGLNEFNAKKIEVLGKFGIKPGDEVKNDHPNFKEIVNALNELANQESTISADKLQVFTADEFTADAIREGDLSYDEAGVLGKWLVKQK